MRIVRRRAQGWHGYKGEYECYTLDEANAKGIIPLKNWREVLLRGDKIEGYVLTDDGWVVPVLRTFAYAKTTKFPRYGIEVPWGNIFAGSKKFEMCVTGEVTPYDRKIRQFFTDEQLRILATLLLAGRPRDDALWTALNAPKGKIADYVWHKILCSGRLSKAMSETIKDIYDRAGVKIEDLVRIGVEMIHDKLNPATVRANLIMNFTDQYLEREGVGKENRPQFPMLPFVTPGGDARVLKELAEAASAMEVPQKVVVPASAGTEGMGVS